MKKYIWLLAFNLLIASSYSQTEEKIVSSIVEALQKQDTVLLLKNCMPSSTGFATLFKEIYSDSPDLIKNMDIGQARNMIAEKLKESFMKLLKTGTDEGIKWENIKKLWSGESKTMNGGVYSLELPFQFMNGKEEYRVVVKYCNQLVKDPTIFILGEFFWEGKVVK